MAILFGESSNHGVAVATAGLGRVAPSGDWLVLIWSTTTAEKKLDFAVVDQAVTTRALLGNWFLKTKKVLKGQEFLENSQITVSPRDKIIDPIRLS